MSYSIAAMNAALKDENLNIAHHSIDIQHALEEKCPKCTVIDEIRSKLVNNVAYFKKFNFIAIGVNSWSFNYCIELLDLLSDYKGLIILGGYAITSTDEFLLNQTFPRADYFIKGYAEKTLKGIILNNLIPENKVIYGKVDIQDLSSPYLNCVLKLNTRKIYWETKRGCVFKCGFCEWGNATNKMIPLDIDRLLKEIELFRNSSIDEVNILDGTFNLGRNYVLIFKKLLEIPNLHITCQARFESCVSGDRAKEFINLCTENRERVHLEFGLQTIHESEMATIGRKNRIDKIEKAMALLKENEIDYETSIIYAIPGQTVASFIDTIEFLIDKGCKTIKAYPLQIPKNSEIEKRRDEYSITEKEDKYNVKSVNSTYSFSKEEREDMDRIAFRLNSGQLVDQKSAKKDFEKLDKVHKSSYLWKVLSIDPSDILPEIKLRLKNDFIDPTLSNISQEDFSQESSLRSTLVNFKTEQEYLALLSNIISGKQQFELRKPIFKIEDIFPSIDNSKFNNPVEDLVPKKYTCNLLISKSGNFYVTRDIVPTH